MTSVALLLAIAAITPGPNNVLVMEAAIRAGVAGAAKAIVAVVLGGLAMLALVAGGLGSTLANAPMALALIAATGTAYLCWLGWALLRAPCVEAAGSTSDIALRPWGVFAFQFANPKGWVMVLTVFAAVAERPGDAAPAWLALALLYTAIPALCLSLWSALGFGLTAWLARPRNRRFFHRAMGLLLIGSALSLARDLFPTGLFP